MKPENRVKQKREALMLTQGELGSLIGMDKRTVRRIEKRQNYPTSLTKDKLAYALLCTVDDIFPRQEPEGPGGWDPSRV